MSADRPFSLQTYRSLLETARGAGYSFVTFRDIETEAEQDRRACLVRHDVDVSLQFALRMARAEAGWGVAATYFVMLRSPAYNLFSRAGTTALRDIVSLGHEIGIHFDGQHPSVEDARLLEMIAQEAALVESVGGTSVHAVSFHQPSPEILDRQIKVPGLINTYNREDLAGWHYVSDSNRYWRGQDPWQMLSSGSPKKIQLLIHPMWWVCDAEEPEEVWNSAVLSNFEAMQEQFLATEAAYGPARTLSLSRRGVDAAPQNAKIPLKEIRGERVTLTPLRDEDSDALFEWINDRSTVILNAPFRPVRRDQHERWFLRIRNDQDLVILAIRTPDDRLIGTCQLHSFSRDHRSAELQIRIGDRAARGQGLGSEAIGMLVRYGFLDLDLARIHLHVFEDNVRAIAAYEKVGFIREGLARKAAFIEGQWKNVVTMGILREELVDGTDSPR